MAKTWIECADCEFGEEPWKDTCPVEMEAYPYAPHYDKDTGIVKYTGIDEFDYKIIGCRGITCEQCWNQESEE